MGIEKASKDDKELVVELVRQLQDHAGLGDEALAVGKTFDVIINTPDFDIFVAKDRGKVIGLLTLWQRYSLFHAGKIAHIDELIIDERHRGKGVGSQLLEKAFEEAKAKGCIEIEVSTGKDNKKALRLYHKTGFKDEYVLLEAKL